MESHPIPDIYSPYNNSRIAGHSGWTLNSCDVNEFSRGDYCDDFLKSRSDFGEGFSDIDEEPAQEQFDLPFARWSETTNPSSLPPYTVLPEGLHPTAPFRGLEAKVPRVSVAFFEAEWPNLLAHRLRRPRYGGIHSQIPRNGGLSNATEDGYGYARFGIPIGGRPYQCFLPHRARSSGNLRSQVPLAPYEPVDHHYLFQTVRGEDHSEGYFDPLSSNGCDLPNDPRLSRRGTEDNGCCPSSSPVHQTLPPFSQRCETIDGEDHEGLEDIEYPMPEEIQDIPDKPEEFFDSDDEASYPSQGEVFADTPDVAGSYSVRDYSPFADSELSAEEPVTSGPANLSRSTFSFDSLPTLQRRRQDSQNANTTQWRRIMAVISSLRLQRRRLRQEQDLLRRQKATLDLKWRNLQQAQRRGTYGRIRRHRRRHSDYDSEAYRTEYFREDEQMHCGENVRTGKGKSKAKTRSYRYSYLDEEVSDGAQLSDHIQEPDRHSDRVSPTRRPQLTAAAIAKANTEIGAYESVWRSLPISTSSIAFKIPYPASNQRPEELLARFPSYISLSPCPSERPSVHTRVQFHAMEFYLRPIGMQPKPEPGDQKLTSLNIAGLKAATNEALERSKVMMDKEVVRWHEDRLRKKGFGEVIDGSGAVLELENEPFKDHACKNEQCRLGQFNKLKWKTVEEREVVQGVWAAVHLLRECVLEETERRRAR